MEYRMPGVVLMVVLGVVFIVVDGLLLSGLFWILGSKRFLSLRIGLGWVLLGQMSIPAGMTLALLLLGW